jgi:hypothetical protein
VVLLVMAALTAGWPLIDRAVADGDPLRDGSVLRLGPGDSTATLRVTGGPWELNASDSNPDSDLTLSSGGVDVDADYVGLAERANAAELWSGLRRVQSVADENSRLGVPRPVRSTGGARGLRGTLSRDGRTGTATVWVAPGGDYAVSVSVLAVPGVADRSLLEGMALANSVTFPRGAS